MKKKNTEKFLHEMIQKRMAEKIKIENMLKIAKYGMFRF